MARILRRFGPPRHLTAVPRGSASAVAPLRPFLRCRPHADWPAEFGLPADAIEGGHM
jgi:hypothetical protein